MKILAISPHTDDVELGCGGTLARFITDGLHVRVMSFGTGNPRSGATENEFRASMRCLGVHSLHPRDFDCRRYNEYRQNILNHMVQERVRREPDLVFVPNTGNVHQDHEVVTAEALRAFKSSCILGYELPWGDKRQVHLPCFIKLSAGDLIKKCEAVACYKSQEARDYTDEGFLYSLATVRGAQAGSKYAESFEVLRWVL